MTPSDLSAVLEINGGYQGDSEPFERAVSLRIDAVGFHDAHFVGGSGSSTAPLDLTEVSRSLLTAFDRQALLKIFDHIAALRAAVTK